jgi:hypothetical protein
MNLRIKKNQVNSLRIALMLLKESNVMENGICIEQKMIMAFVDLVSKPKIWKNKT